VDFFHPADAAGWAAAVVGIVVLVVERALMGIRQEVADLRQSVERVEELLRGEDEGDADSR